VGLQKYFTKRDFKQTPEPKGEKVAAKGRKLAFVVQEHHASRLHYDFRLEMEGVLKSWAVPKGPSMNPHDHHLAVMTEDHPYEYRKFEGVIPKGNYGAGNVIIWDEGWYAPRAETSGDPEKLLLKELKEGHITFILHGEKLQGEFALIKMQGKGDDNWLLIKKGDDFASEADITKQDESVKTHRRVDDLGGKMPDISSFPKANPWLVKPMLCTLVDEPFDREDWLFEIKWDGFRAIGTKHKDEIALYSRNALNFEDRFAPVAEALRTLAHDVILDGEIVAVDDEGRPHFEWLQGWNKTRQGTLKYCVFDILWCDGRDVRDMPLWQRKQLLKYVLPVKHDVFLYSDDVEADGEKLFAEMQRRGLEGMVAKRADSPYCEGDRGQDWLKIKTHMRQEVVIGGYTEPRGGRQYLGSLVVGVYKDSELHYVGHSGGGIPDEQRRQLRDKLAKLERKTSPFAVEPKPNAPVHWVKPELVCEMSFSEWTKEGYMRHPQFEGMRDDKKAAAVHREKSKDVVPAAKKPMAKSTQMPFEPTHLDKVFFPKTKYTKGALFTYYTAVAKYMLPYLADRPHSLNRMPDGVNGPSFYQKNNEHLPEWVPHADIWSDSNKGNLRWMVGGELNTLLYMVQLGCIEINPWNSRVGRLKHPDWIVIDLDPEGVTFEKVIEVAHTVKEVCDAWGIPVYPKTSGKTGIHIFIPTGSKYTDEQCRTLAHLIVIEVNKRQPKITSIERSPEKRKHRIYLDWLQNREGQTLAAPYSVRPTPEANVSMPLRWEEVKPGLKPSDFTIANAIPRLKKTGDLWAPVLGKGFDLLKVLKTIERVQKG
jgi:bifunctional non-homologous end joining protein LigD